MRKTHLKASTTDAGQLDGISEALEMGEVVLLWLHRREDGSSQSITTCKGFAGVE